MPRLFAQRDYRRSRHCRPLSRIVIGPSCRSYRDTVAHRRIKRLLKQTEPHRLLGRLISRRPPGRKILRMQPSMRPTAHRPKTSAKRRRTPRIRRYRCRSRSPFHNWSDGRVTRRRGKENATNRKSSNTGDQRAPSFPTRHWCAPQWPAGAALQERRGCCFSERNAPKPPDIFSICIKR